MKLIIGLGNPEEKYFKNRHNIGFLILDNIYKEFKTNKKLQAKIHITQKENEKIIIAKPTTFMNNSGEAVSKISSFYKIKPTDILVINDDLDLPFGIMKLKNNSGSAGHNGVKSIIDHLNTKEFTRLRFGIGRPLNPIPPAEYVLQNFTPEEQNIIQEKITEIENLINDFIKL